MDSTVSIFKRTKAEYGSMLGFKEVDKIPADETCVICFGGEDTNTNKSANGYGKIVEQTLLDAGVVPPAIYSIKYNLTNYDSGHKSRKHAFYNHRIKMYDNASKDYVKHFLNTIDDNYAYPMYINDLYQNIIKDRISTNNGTKKIDPEQATKNLRKITFLTHCHGGYTMFKLEEKMRHSMFKLGYQKNEIKNILKQVLVVSHAPACPIGKSDTTMISFVSAKDNLRPRGNNSLELYAKERINEEKARFYALKENNIEALEVFQNFELEPMYIEKDKLFYVSNRYELNMDEDTYYFDRREHNIKHKERQQNKDGELMSTISNNILINGVKHSDTTLPDVDKLILGDNPEENKKLSLMFNDMIKKGHNHRVNDVNEFAIEFRKEFHLLKKSLQGCK